MAAAEPWQVPLTLDGYPAPPPDDTEAHLVMASELAQVPLKNARIVEREMARRKELDLEIYRARILRRARGSEKERGKECCP